MPGIQQVGIQSTQHSGVDLDVNGMAHVWRRYRFQAAHKLPNVPMGHKCGRMHGHGFEVIVHANQDLGERDISIDYDHLDEVWAPFHAELNYHCLNEIEGLSNPTSEVISAWLWARMKPLLPELSWADRLRNRLLRCQFRRPELPHLEGADPGQRHPAQGRAGRQPSACHPRPHLHLAPAPEC